MAPSTKSLKRHFLRRYSATEPIVVAYRYSTDNTCMNIVLFVLMSNNNCNRYCLVNAELLASLSSSRCMVAKRGRDQLDSEYSGTGNKH
jgi:hypothetical protein